MIQHEGFWTCYEHCPACAEYAPSEDDVRDKFGRTPTECWAEGDVFRLIGSTVNGIPIGDAGAQRSTRVEVGHESVSPHPRVASTRGLPKKTLG